MLLVPMALVVGCTGAQADAVSADDSAGATPTLPGGSVLAGALPRAGASGTVRELSREAAGAMLAIRPTFTTDSVRLELQSVDGAKLNALIPPVIDLANGVRHAFAAPGVSSDSSEFLGPVTLTLPRDALPLTGTLKAGFCLAGEKLCRLATRAITISAVP